MFPKTNSSDLKFINVMIRDKPVPVTAHSINTQLIGNV